MFPICSHCLMVWEEQGTDYKVMAVVATTVVDGNALCVEHYRVKVLNAQSIV